MSFPIRFQILDDTFKEIPSLEARRTAFLSIGASLVLAIVATVATIFLAIRDLFTVCKKDPLSYHSLLITAGFFISIPLSLFTLVVPEVGLNLSKTYSTFLFGFNEKLSGRNFQIQLAAWTEAFK